MSLVETAKAAVEADRNGNIDDAIKQYMTCVELILKLLEDSEDPYSEKMQSWKEKAEECTSCR